MNKGIKSLAAIVLGLAAVACSSPEKMAEQAENVTVKCNPAVLEVVAGKINGFCYLSGQIFPSQGHP